VGKAAAGQTRTERKYGGEGNGGETLRSLFVSIAFGYASVVMADLPPIRVHYPHVEARPDLLAGSPLVRGTKVPVRRLWAWHRKGVTVETLVKRYPALGPAKVLCALAFAYDNQDVLEADLERERLLLDAEAEKVPGAMEQTRLPFGSKPPGAS